MHKESKFPICKKKDEAFNGEASQSPEFTECFYTPVHCKSSINDNITMIEAVVCRFFKVVPLKILQHSQKNTWLKCL